MKLDLPNVGEMNAPTKSDDDQMVTIVPPSESPVVAEPESPGIISRISGDLSKAMDTLAAGPTPRKTLVPTAAPATSDDSQMVTITPGAVTQAEPDSDTSGMWMAKVYSDEEVTRLADKYGKDKAEVEQYIRVKGGVVDIFIKMARAKNDAEARKALEHGELLKFIPSPEKVDGAAFDFANNMYNLANHAPDMLKGDLLRATGGMYAIDQMSGDKNEMALKDELDQMQKGDMALFTHAPEIAIQMAGGAAVGKFAAAKVAPMVAPMLSPVTKAISGLAARSGAATRAIPYVGKPLAAAGNLAAEWAKLSAEVGAVTGVQSALVAPRGEKVEALGVGFIAGSALVVAGAAGGAAAKGIARATMGTIRGVTKLIDDVGGKAAAKIAASKADQELAFAVAHTGTDVLPNDVAELQRISKSLGVGEDVVTRVVNSKNFIRSLDIPAVGDEIAELTTGMATREAKRDILKRSIPNYVDPKRVRAENQLYDIMNNVPGAGKLPTSLEAVSAYAEAFDLDIRRITTIDVKSKALRDGIGLDPAAIKAMDKLSFNDLPGDVKTKLRIAAYTDAIMEHMSKVTPDTLDLSTRFLKLSAEPRASSEYIEDLYAAFTNRYDLPSRELANTTKVVLERNRKLVGEVVQSLSPESRTAIEVAARKRAIEIFARREYIAFTEQTLPSYLRQRADKVNLPKLFDSIKTSDGVAAAVDSFTWIPEAVRNGARESLNAGRWQDAAGKLAAWSSEVTRGGKAYGMNLASARKYVEKAMHDAGNSPEVIRGYWLNHRLEREMVNIAGANRAASRTATQGLADRAFRALLPKHVVLDDISRRWGLSLDEVNLRLNNSREMSNQRAAEWSDNARELGLTRVKGLIDEHGIPWEDLVTAIENPNILGSISDPGRRNAMRTAIDTYRGVTDWMLDISAGYGRNIERRANYVHHAPVSGVEAITILRKELKGVDLPNITDENLTARMLSPDFAGLSHSLQFVTGHKITGAETFREAVALLSDTRAVSRNLAPEIAAAKSRSITGGIPWLIREKDLMKLTDRSLRQLSRNVFLDADLNKLNGMARALDAIGDEAYKRVTETGGKTGGKLIQASADAAFIRTYMREQAGFGDRGWMSEQVVKQVTMRRVNRLATKFADDPTTLERAIEMPGHVGEIITNLIYSSTLHRPASFIKNLTQTPLVTAAEVRSGKATGIAVASMMKAGAVLSMDSASRGKFGDRALMDVYNYMVSTGRIAAGRIQEAARDIAGTARGTGVMGKVGAAAGHVAETSRTKGKVAAAAELSEWYANGMLYAFGKTEAVNRLGTAVFADDILRGVKAGRITPDDAFGLISSPSVRRHMLSAAESKTFDRATSDMYMDYLLQKSQFVYTEAQKATFIKDVGPILGAFMRYGSEATGIVYNRIRSGNLPDAVEAAVRPLIWLALGQRYIEDIGNESERFRATKEALIGKGELQKMAPITAATDYLLMGLADPMEQTYSMKIISNLRKSIWSDNEKDKQKARGDTIKTLIEITPFVAQYETIVDDLYTRAITGKSETPARDAVKAIKRGTVKKWKELPGDIADWFVD